MKYFLAICVVLAVLSYDTVIFLVHLGAAYVWLKLAVYAALLIIVVLNETEARTRNLPGYLKGLAALLIYMAIPSILAGQQGAYSWFSACVRFSYVIVFLILMRRHGSDVFQRVFKWFGLILAVQSIVLYVLVVSGHAPAPEFVERYAPEKYGGTDLFTSFGILGFGNWYMQSEAGSIAFRVQSICSEANKFAMFQIFPLFACLADPRRRTRDLYFAGIIAASIALTFSFSAYVGLLASAAYYFGMPLLKRYRSSVRVLVIGLVMVGVTTAYYAFSRAIFESGGRDASSAQINSLARSGDSVGARLEWSKAVFGQIGSSPLGIGFSIQENALGGLGALPIAPVQWFFTGGIIGGIIMLVLQGYLASRYYFPGLNSMHRPQRVMAACCLAMMLTSVVHGNWTELVYFLPIAALTFPEAKRDPSRRPPPRAWDAR